MRQLDFTDYKPFASAERQKRYDAFWGPLKGTRRIAALVACDFFSFAAEAMFQNDIAAQLKEQGDIAKSLPAIRLMQEYCTIAMAKFRLFGSLVGCKDEEETIKRLDLLIQYGERRRWRIVPGWWIETKGKKTKYFVECLKREEGERYGYYERLAAQKRKAAEAQLRKAEEKAAKAAAKEMAKKLEVETDVVEVEVAK